MREILIPASIFDFKSKKILKVISGLNKLSSSNYKIIFNDRIALSIQRILANENIHWGRLKRTYSEVSENELHLNEKSGQVYFAKGKYKSFEEFVDVITKADRSIAHKRKTKETSIFIKLNLDGAGRSKIKSGIGFFDHMLEQIARHANIDLTILAKGDLWVDEHHTVEDIGITLGEAIIKALGNKIGIQRYGFAIPMDDSVSICTIDLGGRSYLNFQVKFKRDKIGAFPSELVKEFFKGVAQGLKANIYLKVIGENEHHKVEALFKVFAKALNEACRLDERNKGLLPTTKGLI